MLSVSVTPGKQAQGLEFVAGAVDEPVPAVGACATLTAHASNANIKIINHFIIIAPNVASSEARNVEIKQLRKMTGME